MICQNCNIENNVIYGSGRFCGSKIVRSFSTKHKRKEISDIVSFKTTKRKLSEEHKKNIEQTTNFNCK